MSSTKQNGPIKKTSKSRIQDEEEKKKLATRAKTQNGIKKVPVTPPSHRVMKTQYFPKKDLYANALNGTAAKKEVETKKKPVERKTAIDQSKVKPVKRSVKPTKVANAKPSLSEVKKQMRSKIKKVKSPEVSSDSASATASVSSDRPRTATLEKGTIVKGPNVEQVYEDDFDSYESDFEQYQSSSSTEDMPDSPSCSTCSEEDDLQTMPQIVESERKLDSGTFELNSDDKHRHILENIEETPKVNYASLSDEGFDDEKSSLQFINFVGAQKKSRKLSTAKKRSKRGSELLSMIHLNHQNFTLFDLPAVSYDVFIKSFGNRNSVQVATQTGKDRINEEVQTDLIESKENWSQFPIDLVLESTNKTDKVLEYDEYNLKKFLALQERIFSDLLNETNAKQNFEFIAENLPFSSAKIQLDAHNFKDILHVCFSNLENSTKLLTLHERNGSKSTGCVWDISRVSLPEMEFYCFSDFSTGCFALGTDKLLFAGLQNGGVAVWDLHDFYSFGKQTPNFISESDFKLCSKVVRIQCVRFFKNSEDYQLVTLNENGNITIWDIKILLDNETTKRNVTLLKSKELNLQEQNANFADLLCSDLMINLQEPNHLYIGTNYGVILHVLADEASKPVPKKYFSDNSSRGAINCLELNKSSGNYFLAGCENGNVCLLNKLFEKPLIVISNHSMEVAIKRLRWSQFRPCIFYAMDSANNLLIWNLSVSEMFPTSSTHFEEGIRDVILSPGNSENAYLAVVTNGNKIDLHLLKNEYGLQNEDTFNEDLRRFINYVQRLS